MPNLHLFNPQNDLALANGSPTFTAPQSSVDLANAGACLPMWYGEPGDRFIGAVNAAWFTAISECFGLSVLPTMRPLPRFTPRPWGWSPQTLRYLEDFGFSKGDLPSTRTIEAWRTLSSRVTSAPLLIRLMEQNPDICPDASKAPHIVSNPDEALQLISDYGVAMMKLPWSNAGRGQQITDRTTPRELLNRINGMINRQGAVEISPFYDKHLDFAMLWDENGFMGYSLFETDSHGGWTHNILLSDSDIERRITETLGRSVDFRSLQTQLEELITQKRREYQYAGPLGVDFIVGNLDNTQNYIVPVEINWRRTMGHVSHCLKSRILAENVSGVFRIVPTDKTDQPFHTAADCTVAEHRLLDGTLDLVPPGGKFRFLLSTHPS